MVTQQQVGIVPTMAIEQARTTISGLEVGMERTCHLQNNLSAVFLKYCTPLDKEPEKVVIVSGDQPKNEGRLSQLNLVVKR